eukprot:1808184-Prorocentrum_lima.AAC.1
MDTLEKFYEGLYDKLSEEDIFQYSDGPDLPPLRLNQIYSLTSATSDDVMTWEYRSHIEHDAFTSIKFMHK